MSKKKTSDAHCKQDHNHSICGVKQCSPGIDMSWDFSSRQITLTHLLYLPNQYVPHIFIFRIMVKLVEKEGQGVMRENIRQREIPLLYFKKMKM